MKHFVATDTSSSSGSRTKTDAHLSSFSIFTDSSATSSKMIMIEIIEEEFDARHCT